MRKIIFCSLMWVLCITACQNRHKVKLHGEHMLNGIVIGDSVSDNNIKTVESLLAIIQDRSSVKITIRGIVKSVSKENGSWIRLQNTDNKEIIVRFTNADLYFPQNIVNKEIVLEGEAGYETLNAQQQKDLAIEGNDDALKRKIQTAKEVVFFKANGVTILTKKSS